MRSATYLSNPDLIGVSLKRLEHFLFYLLIFFLPTQLAYHLWPNWAFVFGVRVDYLAPAIYLTDLLVIFLIILSKTKINIFYLLPFTFYAILNIGFSISPWVSFWKWLKILELIFFAKYIFNNKRLLKTRTLAKVFLTSLVLISAIGIIQFLVGGTLGFTLLGERMFDLSTPGIALQEIFGKEFLRAYSTFSHPNSFAGYLFVSVVIFLPNLRKLKFFWPVVIIALVAFLLTFSLSAFIGTGFGLPILLKGFDFSLPEIKERLYLVNISKEIISRNFLVGTGLGTFSMLNKMIQPVHNIFLLIFSEVGAIGFFALCSIFYALFKRHKYLFFFILVTGLMDHYWLTLQQNMLLLALVYGYFF